MEITKEQAYEISRMLYNWRYEERESLGEDYIEGYIGGTRDFLNVLGISEKHIKSIVNEK